MSAWAPSFFARANAPSKSSRLRTGSDRSLTPNALAAASISVRARFPLGPPDCQRKATRATLGKASLSSSNRLPSRSGAMRLSPVIFPPGRARLETSFCPTGSFATPNTMGIVTPAFLAAKVAVPEVATMTSTLSWTSSAARSARASTFGRNRHADLLGGLEIDDELELRRLLDGNVGGLGAFAKSYRQSQRRAGISPHSSARSSSSRRPRQTHSLRTSPATGSWPQSPTVGVAEY